MGVPNFYSWLCKRYPMCRYPFTQHNGHRVDFLYLDMNQVIYKCATNQTILKDQMIQRNIEEMWTSILNYINQIINLVDPQLVVYLTFDGVAPRAKANQQRQRRFASSKSDIKIQQLLKALGMEQSNQTFKNNQITAGTEFMHELNEQVRFFLNCKFQEDPKYKKLKVIFSGSDVPGEGEHKILEFMRGIKNSPDSNPEWSHCIYSADADLIMLGLGIHIKNISIIREGGPMDRLTTQIASKRDVEKVQFELINLQIVKEYFDLEYREIQMKVQYNVERVIDDFLLLFFLVGNDFLPRVYCFDIKQGTVELLIDTFKEFLQQSENYVTENGQIRWEQMTLLAHLLSKFEIKAIENRADELKKQMRQTDHPDFEEYKIQWEDELKILQSLNLQFSNNNAALARKLFYSNKCNIDIDSEEGKQQISKMVQKYLEGIQFVFSYYNHKVPSWEWYYNHYYSPLCFDIYMYLSTNQNIQIQFNPSQPYEPYQQLLLILPPHNASLLPTPYRALYDTNLSPLRQPIDYYPSEYEIDPFGAIWEHQFIYKVIFMNSDLLLQEYQKVDKSQLTEKEIQRCQFKNPTLYYYGQKAVLVKSKLPSIYKDEYVFISETQLTSSAEDATIVLTYINLQQIQQQIPVLPSLNIFKITNSYLKNKKDKYKNQKVMKVELEQRDLRFLDQIEKASDNSQSFNCYCGYPSNYYGEIGLIITKTSLLLLKNYSIKDFNILQDYKDEKVEEVRQDIYDDLKNILHINQDNKGVGFNSCGAIAIVVFYKEIVRNQDRTFTYNQLKIREEVMPLEWISEIKLVGLQDYILDQESQLINEKVILIDQKKGNSITGSVGIVKSQSPPNNYVVDLQREPIINIDKSKITQLKYFDIKYVADQLQVDIETLLYIMGTVRVFLGDKKKQTELIAQQVDIGFNATHRGRNQLVPELLRIHEAQFDLEGYEKFQQFQKIEISEIMLNDLKEYQKRLPQMFNFLQSRGKDKLKSLQQIKISDLFGNDDVQEGLNQVLRLYIWLISLPTSQFYLSNVASSSFSCQTIRELEKQKGFKKNQQKILTQRGWLLNCEKYYVPPLMTEHPKLHQLGDRVVSLNNNYTEFGQYGIVVGLIDIGEIMVEILWDKARFGLTNLGGKCSALRGSVVRFLDVFNLSQHWEDQLNTSMGGVAGQKGWTYKQKVFVPSFDKPENRQKKGKPKNTTNS